MTETAPIDPAEMLTMAEAGELLRVSRATMYRLTTSGHLGYLEFPGGKRMTSRQFIAEFLERNTVPARSEAVVTGAPRLSQPGRADHARQPACRTGAAQG